MHGANFSIHLDRGKLRCAKRKGFLDENEDFFGHFSMLSRLRSSLASMARDIMEELKAEKVIIYGAAVVRRFMSVASKESCAAASTPIPTSRKSLMLELCKWAFGILLRFSQNYSRWHLRYSPAIEFLVFDVAVWSATHGARFLPFKLDTCLQGQHCLRVIFIAFARLLECFSASAADDIYIMGFNDSTT